MTWLHTCSASLSEDERTLLAQIPVEQLQKKRVVVFYPGSGDDVSWPLAFVHACFTDVEHVTLHMVDPELGMCDMPSIVSQLPFSFAQTDATFTSDNLTVHMHPVGFEQAQLPDEIDLYFERAFGFWRDEVVLQRVLHRVNGFVVCDEKPLTDDLVHTQQGIGFYGQYYVCKKS